MTVYRDIKRGEVGLTLSSTQNTIGDRVVQIVLEAIDELREQLGDGARVSLIRGRERLNECRLVGDLAKPEVRAVAFEWLRERANTFVNVLRPRIRSAVADLTQQA